MDITIKIPRIYTGYFGQFNTYVDADLTSVAISASTPFDAPQLRQLILLAPPKDLLRAKKSKAIDWIEFEFEYRKYLATLPMNKVIEILTCLSVVDDSTGVVFLGYEKDCTKCHRSILADYLNKSNLIDTAIEEFK